MNRVFLFRLVLDGLAAGLLLLGLAYWWLGNTVHEVAGTVMFLLLIVHNVFNRRWYGMVAKARREPRSLFNIGVTFALLLAILVLLVTSILISNALAPILPIQGGFTVRQIHTLVAYWALVLMSIHLGLRWPTIMSVARHLCGIAKPNAARTTVLRVVSLAIALHGVWNSVRLGLDDKLSMRMTLDWWDFEASVAGFFVHCVAVSGFLISVTHYGVRLFTSRRSAKPAKVAFSVTR